MFGIKSKRRKEVERFLWKWDFTLRDNSKWAEAVVRYNLRNGKYWAQWDTTLSSGGMAVFDFEPDVLLKILKSGGNIVKYMKVCIKETGWKNRPAERWVGEPASRAREAERALSIYIDRQIKEIRRGK